MESDVKFKQIAVVGETDTHYGEILGLSEDGDVWQFVRNGEDVWNKIGMPMDWHKAFDDEMAHNNNHHWSREVLRNVHLAYLKRIHDSCVKLAHAAFMLHPGLREE